MMIEDFGARVTSVWEGLRSTTRSLVVGALQSIPPSTQPTTTARSGGSSNNNAVTYDARADWELSRLLAALDERAMEAGVSLSVEQIARLHHLAEACAAVLQNQTRSAEVFVQLLERAYARCDYSRIDALADALTARFAPSEICELARSASALARALAHEALAQLPTPALFSLLVDPIDAEIARDAIERQAIEYGSEEARQLMNAINQVEIAEEDF